MPAPSRTPTLAEVAGRLGVSKAAVSRYLTGKRTPTIRGMMRIAEVYRWTVADQAEAQAGGTWREGFQNRLAEFYG